MAISTLLWWFGFRPEITACAGVFPRIWQLVVQCTLAVALACVDLCLCFGKASTNVRFRCFHNDAPGNSHQIEVVCAVD